MAAAAVAERNNANGILWRKAAAQRIAHQLAAGAGSNIRRLAARSAGSGWRKHMRWLNIGWQPV